MTVDAVVTSIRYHIHKPIPNNSFQLNDVGQQVKHLSQSNDKLMGVQENADATCNSEVLRR